MSVPDGRASHPEQPRGQSPPGAYARAVLRRLVQTDSVNPDLAPDGAGEGDIARLVASELREMGLEVRVLEHRPGRPSVLARLPGSADEGRSLLLNAHTDTVGVEGMDRPFSGEIRDGRLYGRGAYDMKGGLAACLAAARELATAASTGDGLAGDLWVAAVADEERASEGTREVLRQVRPDAVVVTEPTELELCVAHKGFVWVEIETRGRAAHGSRPDLGVDANLTMARILAEVHRLGRELRGREAHPLLGPASLHVGELRGGTAPSVYAEACRSVVERRTLPGEETDSVLREITDCVARAAGGDPDADVTAEVVLARPPFETTARAPVVEVMARAVEEVLSRRPELTGQGPWMDAALHAESGSDTVVIGPAGAGAHAREEWVELASVDRLAAILVAGARTYLGRDDPDRDGS